MGLAACRFKDLIYFNQKKGPWRVRTHVNLAS
jgi:hypothetical protein